MSHRLECIETIPQTQLKNLILLELENTAQGTLKSNTLRNV